MYRNTIDHSNGLAHAFGNDVFYSPNCSRLDIEAPLPVDETRGLWGLSHHLKSHPKSHRQLQSHPKSYRIAQHHQPQWWTPAFGWMSFIPLQPTFTGYPLDRLAHIPRLQYARTGSYLPPLTVDSWKRFESKLCHAVYHLRLIYREGMMIPFSPGAWRYDVFAKNRAVAEETLKITVDWFVLWITAFSWLIAVGGYLSRDTSEDEGEGKEHWFTVLKEEGCEESWLSGLVLSMAGDFTPHTPRVGVFLDLKKPGRGQPSPRWFIKHGIPIWYRPQSVPAGEEWSDFRVPQHKLTTALHRHPHPSRPSLYHQPDNHHPEQSAPPPPSPPPGPSPASPSPSSTEAPIQKPWIEFFAKRTKRNAESMKTETAAETQRRKAREANPGRSSAKVFVWVLTFTDPPQWKREEVTRKRREETLSEYSGDQLRFDAFRNEWDCCEEFGEPEEMDEDGDEGYPDPEPNAIQPNEDYQPPERQRSPSPPPLTDDDVVSENPEVFEIQEILRYHFGFVTPPPDLSRKPPVTNPDQRKKFLHSLGLSGTENGIFTIPLGSVVWDFVHGLSATPLRCPDSMVWDVSRDNPLTLFQNLRLLGNLFRVGESFVFFFRHETIISWHIMVENPGDALYVCRLHKDYKGEDIALALLRQGIRFRTLAPVPNPPRRLPCPELALPHRSENYVFTKRDYDAYVDQRTAILRGPRGRAALMRGGYVWRLARATVSEEDVLDGPCQDEGHTFCLADRRDYLWDNELSNMELDLICGAYVCDTSE